MPDKLLGEFPETSYEQWREQVTKDLKGADFQKRLVTRTVDGLEVQPLYTARDTARDVGLGPYRLAASPLGKHGARWDIRAELATPELTRAKDELRSELARGASSLWLRFDESARLGLDQDAANVGRPDGLPCGSLPDLADLLAEVDLARIPVVLDAGGNTPVIGAAYLALAAQRGTAGSALRGSLGNDPLGALARDGRLPYTLDIAGELSVELARLAQQRSPELRSFVVSTTTHHDAGASNAQEIAYALATSVSYLGWLLAGGLSRSEACRQLEFRVGIAGDLFAELAKIRALRLCFAKLVSAAGGDETARHTQVHAVTSRRTKTLRDPWVNMLRTTTEAFSAMVGGADSLTTRGFDEAIGPSEPFARRIARNVQVILNEEAHVTHVADPAGGSYYLESLTEALAREAWQHFQRIEAQGGMAAALEAGRVHAEIAELADKRAKAVARRVVPITGVSEFANLAEEALVREAAVSDPIRAQNRARLAQLRRDDASHRKSNPGVLAAISGRRLEAALGALSANASVDSVTRALAGNAPPAEFERLPVRRDALGFEALRARADVHAAETGRRVHGFLCNLGAIPQHKACASFASGFLHAGGVAALDNEGFESPEAARDAFADSDSKLAVICGSDPQYLEWVPKLAPLLRAAGAVDVVLAGRPGEHEAAFRAAGVSEFIYVGTDVCTTLSALLDRLGVKP